MNLGIDDKLALVTGAGDDIGRATAMALAGGGARLLLTDLDDRDLDESVKVIRDASGLIAETKTADLTDADSISELMSVAGGLGGIDICVHAAGVTGAKGDPLELSDDDWEQAWAIDFMSAVRMSRAVVPPMVDKDGVESCSSVPRMPCSRMPTRCRTTWPRRHS